MKKQLIILALALFFIGCGNQGKQKQTTDQVENEVTVLTVDELYEKAAELEGKEILVKGTVMHVCKHGGERCFIMGSNEDIIIRIEAGEKIGAFDQKLMGSDIEVSGVLKQVRTEAEAHNPAQHQDNREETFEDVETETAHKTISDSQEDAEVIYYIEGLRSKEI